MPTYRITERYPTYAYCYIEADSEGEALLLSTEMEDDDQWSYETDYDSWDLRTVELVDES